MLLWCCLLDVLLDVLLRLLDLLVGNLDSLVLGFSSNLGSAYSRSACSVPSYLCYLVLLPMRSRPLAVSTLLVLASRDLPLDVGLLNNLLHAFRLVHLDSSGDLSGLIVGSAARLLLVRRHYSVSVWTHNSG